MRIVYEHHFGLPIPHYFFIGFILTHAMISQMVLSARCLCGTSLLINTRVVGGVDAERNEFPWQVAVITRWSTRPFCGGSLLNDRYVVTAAHCIIKPNAWQVRVVLGENDWTEYNKNRKIVYVERLIIHEKFNPFSLLNDIGLIKMKNPTKFTSAYRPACLLRPKINLAGVVATATGWGRLYEGGSVAYKLQKVKLPIISLEKCRSAFGYYMVLSSEICAMYPPGGKDTCSGDSGGPLTYYNNGRFYLIGLVSWGFGCARRNTPAIYTRINAFYPWLDKNMVNAKSCSD